jgi:hypothetical protein
METLVGTEGDGDVLEKAGGRMRDMGFRRCTREREIEKRRRVHKDGGGLTISGNLRVLY